MAGKAKTTSVGGKRERKETKAERQARLEAAANAEETCRRILPVAGIVLILLIIAFVTFVKSQPVNTTPLMREQPRTIDMRDFSIDELMTMADTSGDEELKRKVEEYKLLQEQQMGMDGEAAASEGGAEDETKEEVVEL